MRVLVTAGAEKQSLAAVRSLGRAGFEVHVLDPKPDAPAFRSRWCRARFVSPSNRDRAAYVSFLEERLRATPYVTVLACDDLSATYLSEERERFGRWTALALPSGEDFRTATDKTELVRTASALGIPVPHTTHPESPREAEAMAGRLGFPVIVKGAHGWGAQHVRLVHAPADFARLYGEVAALERAPETGAWPMLQEFVRGTGYGFSTLFRHGEPRAIFLHRRAAEFDVAGGGTPYSCPLAESVRDAELETLGLRLFRGLRWHGLGMAEWRRETSTGRYVLMEINPRLVGSTDLAVRSGVDLPLLACRMLAEGDVEPVLAHRAGMRLRWLLPDGLRDLLARPARVLAADTWRAASDWCWRDPAPHWMQLRIAAWQVLHGR